MKTIEKQKKLLLTTREVCDVLSLSMSTIRRWLKAGVITDVRVGRRRMISVEQVIRLAENGVSLARLKAVKEAVNQTTGESVNAGV